MYGDGIMLSVAGNSTRLLAPDGKACLAMTLGTDSVKRY